jgi:hypothetical protein
MSATSAPFGFRPVYHPSGLDRAVALAGGIPSAYATGILKNQPVALDTNGNIIIATAGSAFIGVFAGVEYTDVSGRRQINNQWPANTAYQAGSCIVYYYQDQQIVYEVQSNATLAQTSIGDQCNMASATAGSTTTGLSAAMLGTVVGSGSQGDFRIIDIAPYAGNAWGDSFVIVRVQISRHQYTANIVAI